MKGNNACGKNQKIVVTSAQLLLENKFLHGEVTKILSGSNSTSGKILKTITRICLKLKKEGKSNEFIVHYVRQGDKDSNRKKVVNDFIQETDEKLAPDGVGNKRVFSESM